MGSVALAGVSVSVSLFLLRWAYTRSDAVFFGILWASLAGKVVLLAGWAYILHGADPLQFSMALVGFVSAAFFFNIVGLSVFPRSTP